MKSDWIPFHALEAVGRCGIRGEEEVGGNVRNHEMIKK